MSSGRFVVAVALLSVIGCAPDEIALVSTGPLDDLAKIPQDATAFAEIGGPPILEVNEHRLREFGDYWYGPWVRTEPEVCTAEEFSWAAESFPNSRCLVPTCWKSPPPVLKPSRRTRNSANIPVEPTTGSQSETHRCARFPSADPFFYDFRNAGEGYPFDYNQNSAVWAGTPLFLSHTSQDGRFLAAESPYACGWIDSGHRVCRRGVRREVPLCKLSRCTARSDTHLKQPDRILVPRPDRYAVAHDDKVRNQPTSASSGGGCKPSCVGDTRSSVGPGRRSISSSVL